MKIFSAYENYEIKSLTVNRALNKLAKAGVEVFNAKKIDKNCIRFSVKAKDSRKIFAIFQSSCYTINRCKEKGLKKLLSFALYRIGAIIGVLLFLFLVCFSQRFVFKVEVTGSGSHYKREIENLLQEQGLCFFSVFDKEKASLARSQILKLPAVSYCSVQKSGGVIFVSVEISAETPKRVPIKNLVAKYSGTLIQLITIRGTPLFSEGDKVEKGDILVSGYELYNDEKIPTPSIAKAIIKGEVVCQHSANEESEKSLSEAYAKALLLVEGCDILNKSASVERVEDTFVYTIKVEYTAIIAVNMD